MPEKTSGLAVDISVDSEFTATQGLESATAVTADRLELIDSGRTEGLFEVPDEFSQEMDPETEARNALAKGEFDKFIGLFVEGKLDPEQGSVIARNALTDIYEHFSPTQSEPTPENQVRNLIDGIEKAILKVAPNENGKAIASQVRAGLEAHARQLSVPSGPEKKLRSIVDSGADDLREKAKKMMEVIDQQMAMIDESGHIVTSRASLTKLAVKLLLEHGGKTKNFADAARYASRLSEDLGQRMDMAETVIHIARDYFGKPSGTKQELEQMAREFEDLTDRFDLEKRYVGDTLSAEQLAELNQISQNIEKAKTHSLKAGPDLDVVSKKIKAILTDNSQDLEKRADDARKLIVETIGTVQEPSRRTEILSTLGNVAVAELLPATGVGTSFGDNVREAYSLARVLGVENQLADTVIGYAERRFASPAADKVTRQSQLRELSELRKEFELEARDIGRNLTQDQSERLNRIEKSLGSSLQANGLTAEQIVDAITQIQDIMDPSKTGGLDTKLDAVSTLIRTKISSIQDPDIQAENIGVLASVAAKQALNFPDSGISFSERLALVKKFTDGLNTADTVGDALYDFASKRFNGKGTLQDLQRQGSELTELRQTFGLSDSRFSGLASKIDAALQKQKLTAPSADEVKKEIERILGSQRGVTIGGRREQIARAIDQASSGLAGPEGKRLTSELTRFAVSQMLRSAPESSSEYRQYVTQAYDLTSYFGLEKNIADVVIQSAKDRFGNIHPDTKPQEIESKIADFNYLCDRFDLQRKDEGSGTVTESELKELWQLSGKVYAPLDNWRGTVNIRKARGEISAILASRDRKYSDLDDRQQAIEKVIRGYVKTSEDPFTRDSIRNILAEHAVAEMFFYREPGKATDFEDNFDQMEDLIDNLGVEFRGKNKAIEVATQYFRDKARTADSVYTRTLLEQLEQFRDELDLEEDDRNDSNTLAIEHLNSLEDELRKRLPEEQERRARKKAG